MGKYMAQPCLLSAFKKEHIMKEGRPVVAETALLVNTHLGAWTEVGEQTEMHDSCLGDYSYICARCHCMFADMGKFVSIANHVRINPSNHPMWRATQHHFTYRSSYYGMGEDDAEFFQWRKAHAVTVGHDVWMGHGAQVMPGVSVGTGAVLAAGAVATRDVPPYAIMVGVPARPLRQRFSPDVAEKMLALAWWDWPHEKLAAALPDFRQLSAAAFLEKHSLQHSSV